jgi:hypothetical protein
MTQPQAIGMVLAQLVTAEGRVVERSSVKGQLYVSPEEVVVIRPTGWERWLDRLSLGALAGSVVLVLLNVAVWQRLEPLGVAAGLQAFYWLTLGRRRRALAARELSAAEVDAARQAGRAAIFVPAGAVKELVPPEPPRAAGFRKPARLVLPDGALEIYLDEPTFGRVRTALGRGI